MKSIRQKQKLAFLFTSPLYVRNYIENNTLDNLILDKDNLIIFQNCSSPECFTGQSVKIKNLSFIQKIRYQLAEKLKSRVNQNKAKSFITRMRREKIYFFQVIKNFKNFKQKSIIITLIQFIIPLFIYKLGLGNFGIRLLAKKKENKILSKLLKEKGIDILVIPSGGAEAEMHYALESCKICSVKSVLIIDNWDNLSSKSVLIHKPNRMMVWGAQMADHAKEIQGMNYQQIYEIGCSRFETYYKKTDKIKVINDPYILFVGMACQFDEKRILQQIDNEISLNKKLPENLKILYRPHPWQKNPGNIREDDFKNLILDPQIKNHYKNGVWKIDFQPSLSYYPSLIKGAELVIGGASTFLIEATIMKKNYIVIAIKEKINNSIDDSYSILNSYTHLEGIRNFKFIEFCYQYEDIINLIEKVRSKKLSNKDVDQFINYYAGNNKFERYEKRFINSMEELF